MVAPLQCQSPACGASLDGWRGRGKAAAKRGGDVRYTVICSAKDEGAFLVEWVAWQRMIGFTDVVVVTNDCTDASPALLDAMAARGWVTHLRCAVPAGGRITATKLAAAKVLPQVAGADWVMVADVDEFVNIHSGAGRLPDLLGGVEGDFLGMSIPWRVFGTMGRARWEDGLQHRIHTRAAGEGDKLSAWVKSIHRHPGRFLRLGEHSPKKLRTPYLRDWGIGGLRWVNPAGAEVTGWTPEEDSLRTLPPRLRGFGVAQINHFMLRNAESFALKRGTPSPVAGRDRYTDDYWQAADRNEAEDHSILRHAAAFDAVYGPMMADTAIAALHHRCCADYVARLVAKAGGAVQDDPRWQHHMARCG